MATLNVAIGEPESAILARAAMAGRPGYLDTVTALLETAADVAEHCDVTNKRERDAALHTLADIARLCAVTIRQAQAYVRTREVSQ